MAWNFLQGDKKPGGGVFGFLKSVGEGLANPLYKVGNEVAAIPRVISSIPSGNFSSAERILKPNTGIGHQGGFLGGEELTSNKAVFSKASNVKKVVAGGVNVASNIIPGVAGAKGATLTAKAAAGAKAGAPLSFLSSSTNQLADTGKIDPAQLAKDTAVGTVVGAAIPVAGAGVKKAVSIPAEIKAQAETQASKVSGLKPENVLNNNEANTLRDFADYRTGSYNPTGKTANNLHAQARHAAQTAGIDITSGSPKEVTDRIYDYLSRRTQHIQAKSSLLQGGYIKLPGEDANKLASTDNPEVVKKTLEGKLPPEQVDNVAPAIAITKDKHIVSKLAEPKISELGGARPNNDIQTAIEQAHNAGDNATAARLISQLPPEDQQAMKSALGVGEQPATTPTVSAPVPAPQAPADPFKDITDAINGKQGIAEVTAKNKAALTQERGQRFTASKAAGESADGSQGYYKELSKLKGEYSKTKLGGMIENIGPQRAEELFTQARKQIQAVPDETYNAIGLHPQGARLNTQTAIRKIIFGENGGVPTESELKLIKIVAPDLAKDIESKIPKSRKLFDFAAKLAGIPRALQSTFDLSMGGRQGLLVAARHPVQWARANKESVKYLKSTKYFDEQMAKIRSTPEYELGQKYGLATPAADKAKEEAYASSDLAEKIPGVGKVISATERAYNGGLTKLRSDLWKHTLDAYGGALEAEKSLGTKGMKDLAEAVNTLTGRGGKRGGLVDTHMKSLSTTLFSPRLWAARLNTLNPVYYARLSPAARKVALENAGAFAAVAGVVLGAAAALGAEVETDARSSDFLKIKVGDTRYDILGGLQQNIVFAWRELTGEKKSSTNGAVTKLGEGYGAPTRLSVASDLVSNKLNPTFAFATKALEGKDRGGQPFNPAAEIAKLFIPINLTGVYESAKSTGSLAKGIGVNLPNTVGIGTQTYGIQDLNLSDKQKAYVKKLTDKGASPEQITATTRFYQTLKTAPDRQKASDDINKALAVNDFQKAIQIARDYNQKYAASFKDWAKKYGKYGDDKQLLKDYSAQKIRLTNTTVKQRLQTIKDNPSKYGG